MARYLVTSALPYINGVKHLGNMVGSILPADVYARFLRMEGHDAIYICGTDEHGTPAELGAIEEKLDIHEYCRRYHEKQKDIYERFGIRFDYFGRTSSPSNHATTQHLFKRLWDHGMIEERTTRQMYSPDDQRFLPDRFIQGICPKCGYTRARGDQCDGCGALLDPEDLKEPCSAISGSKRLEMRESRHLYLRLTKMQETIATWIEGKQDWPRTVLGIARKWLQEGLQERCITRDLKWGVPVPLPGYEDKVFYVWFDAPIGYISITKDWAAARGEPDLWKTYWKSPDTKLVQFMGKDNVPFHAVTWPATMMGADDGFILATYIKGFEWLQYEGGKFSTSQKRGVFSDQALDVCPADYWRFYLLYNAPEKADSNFSWNDFGNLCNSGLADSLGNFAQRVLSMVGKRMNGQLPAEYAPRPEDKEIFAEAEKAAGEYRQFLYELKFSQAVRRLHEFWIACNQYIDKQKPWSQYKTDPAAGDLTLTVCVHLIRAAAVLAAPVIAESSQKIFAALGLPDDVSAQPMAGATDFRALLGRTIPPDPKPIFAKFEAAQIAEYVQRFGGA